MNSKNGIVKAIFQLLFGFHICPKIDEKLQRGRKCICQRSSHGNNLIHMFCQIHPVIEKSTWPSILRFLVGKILQWSIKNGLKHQIDELYFDTALYWRVFDVIYQKVCYPKKIEKWIKKMTTSNRRWWKKLTPIM